MARGNTKASNLLRASTAAYKSQQSLQDVIQADTYNQSDRSPEAFKAYKDYLSGRISKESDPMRQVSLQKNIEGAYRAFSSSEITRASIGVLEGNQTNQDKYNTVVGLIHAAKANGDDYLAQQLVQRADTISVALQNEAARGSGGSGGSGGGSGNSYNAKVLAAQADDLLTGDSGSLKALREGYSHGGRNALDSLSKGGHSYLSIAKDILEAAAQKYQDAANDPSATLAEKRSYLEKAAKIVNGDGAFPVFNDAHGSAKGLSLDDINRYVDAESNGGDSPFTPVSNANGEHGFLERKAVGLQLYKDPTTGQFQYRTKYDIHSTPEQDKANKAASDKLTKLGYGVSTNKDGSISVTGQDDRAHDGFIDHDGNFVFRDVDESGNPVYNRIGVGDGAYTTISQQELAANFKQQLDEQIGREGGVTDKTFDLSKEQNKDLTKPLDLGNNNALAEQLSAANPSIDANTGLPDVGPRPRGWLA